MLISQSRDEISLSMFFFCKKNVFVSDRCVVITQKKMSFDLEVAD